MELRPLSTRNRIVAFLMPWMLFCVLANDKIPLPLPRTVTIRSYWADPSQERLTFEASVQDGKVRFLDGSGDIPDLSSLKRSISKRRFSGITFFVDGTTVSVRDAIRCFVDEPRYLQFPCELSIFYTVDQKESCCSFKNFEYLHEETTMAIDKKGHVIWKHHNGHIEGLFDSVEPLIRNLWQDVIRKDALIEVIFKVDYQFIDQKQFLGLLSLIEIANSHPRNIRYQLQITNYP